MININFGPIYTQGSTFRARAEAVQRKYRSEVLNAGYCKYGHLSDGEAALEGANFVCNIAFEKAFKRYKEGKGVASRTFVNMLSSQAMCFNIFAPLAENLDLASSIFSRVIPSITTVNSIEFEYTPPKDLFEDQTGISGVDCDLLVNGTTANGLPIIIVIETKFVEPDFSSCGFKSVCNADKVDILKEDNGCLYWKDKGYLYWK